jgi:DEAD/DEAH box helicase domain-containing protein
MNKFEEVFFDVETKTFFDEGGTKNPENLGVSLVSVYRRIIDDNFKEIEGAMHSFFEKDLKEMWKLFQNADRIVGFNSIKFDLPALKPYAPSYFFKLPHFDLIDKVKKAFGRRVSLDSLAKSTLGRTKIDSGANAVIYWQRGDEKSLKLLRKYCEEDVAITRDIYDFGLKNKKLKLIDHWNTPREIEVDFSYKREETSPPQIGLF